MSNTMIKVIDLKMKPKGIKIEEVDIMPSTAEAWLSKNTRNRKFSRATVDRYVREMTSGNWHVTGDAIRFDPDGILLDGQHRLMACVKSGVSFRSFVMYGVDSKAQIVIDTNMVRRAADELTMRGEKGVNVLVAAARWVIDYRRQDCGMRPERRVTNTETIKTIDRHPELRVSAVQVLKCKGPSESSLAFMHFVASFVMNQPDKATAFIDVFKTGLPSYDGCAAHKLREYHLASRQGIRINRVVAMNLLIKSWNSFAANEPVTKLHSPNKFVKINGLSITDMWVPDSVLISGNE